MSTAKTVDSNEHSQDSRQWSAAKAASDARLIYDVFILKNSVKEATEQQEHRSILLLKSKLKLGYDDTDELWYRVLAHTVKAVSYSDL